MHDGQPCPLVTGADAVLIDGLPLGDLTTDPSAFDPVLVAAALAKVHPDANVIVVDESSSGWPTRVLPIDLHLDEHNLNHPNA